MTEDPKPRAPLTEQLLRDHAAWYLERWWPSADRLRRVLCRKADRHARDADERQQGHAWAAAIVREKVDCGALDDRRFAAAWVEELHRKGASRRKMAAKLREKGVAGDVVTAAIDALDAEVDGDPELARAIAYARRRRLGSLRDPDQRDARRDKDLAAMARAGFSYDLAKRVVDADDLTSLTTWG